MQNLMYAVGYLKLGDYSLYMCFFPFLLLTFAHTICTEFHVHNHLVYVLRWDAQPKEVVIDLTSGACNLMWYVWRTQQATAFNAYSLSSHAQPACLSS